MIDHTSFSVSDYQKSKTFYEQTLAELGYILVMEIKAEEGFVAGFGMKEKPSFLVGF